MTGETLQLGLAGLGTVGSGVYETLCRNRELLEARAQISYAIRKVAVGNINRRRDVEIAPELLTDDWRELVNDPEIDIIIELIGGTDEAYQLVKAALMAGKPVVTGNKAVLAVYGSELFKLSAEMGTPLYFEASCGGGIPIIQSLQNSLICNKVQSIAGIINGTSNYILTSMKEQGLSLDVALANAQKLGFAEADPSFDINGWDAAHKALILAMLAYGTPLSPDKIHVHGIEKVESVDIAMAEKLGYTIKLLVVIKHHEEQGALELRVQPSFVPQEHLLSSVDGVFNAIAVKGDIVGETIFYGRGAGKNPTSSAVIGDIVLAMRECRLPDYHTGFQPYTKELEVLPMSETVTPYYVRFVVEDRPGMIAAIAAMLAKYDVSISATSSNFGYIDEQGVQWNNLIFMVHACKWVRLKYVLRELRENHIIDRLPIVFRIETFND
ncbi:MAG: homoserine dehydrogenase [Akkermansia sp.]|nr:homoserine dehydrogenase [Akkermansia sp.]